MYDGLLIEQVSLFPQLYVKSDQRYKNVRLKENAWKSIAEVLGETPEACEHRWKILRNKYTGLKREYRCTPSGSGASEITWPYFEMMRFLDPYLQTRKSFSNLSLKKKPEIKELDLNTTIFEDDLSQGYDKENSPERNVEDEVGPSTSSQNLTHEKISYTALKQISAKSACDHDYVNTSSQTPKKRLSTNFPRTTIPAKKQKTDVLAEKMTGCFETFQKVLENNTNQSTITQPDGDEYFVRSLMQDLKVFSHKEKIIIKKEIYNLLGSHLQSDSD